MSKKKYTSLGPTRDFYLVWAQQESEVRIVSCPESWDQAASDVNRMIDKGYIARMDKIKKM